MQSRKQTTRKEMERKGLAVPIALLALFVVGVLVTGVFYLFSREPGEDTSTVSVGQTVAPETGPWVRGLPDSIRADSLAVPADTFAPNPSGGPAPLSGDPVNTASRFESVPERASTPASRTAPKVGIPRVDPLH